LNTLTKVCIVVLVVLILVSMPVFITLANIVPNWHKAFVQEQQQKLIAESNHRVAMASTNTLLANYERNKAVNAAKITALEAAVQQRDEQIKAANLADVQLRADLGSAQDATKRQQTLAASQLDVNKELIGQIDKQRTQINEKDTEIISLRKAKDDAEANSVRDKAAARLALEQLVAADMKSSRRPCPGRESAMPARAIFSRPTRARSSAPSPRSRATLPASTSARSRASRRAWCW
jgi:hypothetical protein